MTDIRPPPARPGAGGRGLHTHLRCEPAAETAECALQGCASRSMVLICMSCAASSDFSHLRQGPRVTALEDNCPTLNSVVASRSGADRTAPILACVSCDIDAVLDANRPPSPCLNFACSRFGRGI